MGDVRAVVGGLFMKDVFDVVGVLVGIEDYLSSFDEAGLETGFLQNEYYFALVFDVLGLEMDWGGSAEEGERLLDLLVLGFGGLLVRGHSTPNYNMTKMIIMCNANLFNLISILIIIIIHKTHDSK